jgi:hypothetical protein
LTDPSNGRLAASAYDAGVLDGAAAPAFLAENHSDAIAAAVSDDTLSVSLGEWSWGEFHWGVAER